MTPLYTQEEFENAGARDYLPLKCEQCSERFEWYKSKIMAVIKGSSNMKGGFCSRRCARVSHGRPTVKSCANCNAPFTVSRGVVQHHERRKLNNYFCSQRCSGLYNAAHKATGNRRSKLECWLEEQLNARYPDLHIHYNKTSAIPAELDIYIPSFKLAFELNGIFHYEPIFGTDKLDQTRNKDRYKLHACTEAEIDLCVIDTSGVRYFKPKSSQRFLDIITKIVDERMAVMTGLAPARVPT